MRILRGIAIGAWGIVSTVPTVGWYAWPVIALCVVWGVIYAIRPPSLSLALAQAGCTYLAVMFRIALLYQPSWEALLWSLVFGTLFFGLWMTPVGIISSYIQDGASRANP